MRLPDVNKLKNSEIIPSLDGFRALSIVIVAASHCGFGSVIPGGLGVTVFFFLSGYLISILLLREYDREQVVNIKHFYLRRALRLYPPLLITLIITYSAAYLGVLGGGISWNGLLAQLFYFANYYQLFFAPVNGVPKGTEILWSLAVEEHFYLIYPIVFLALAPATRRSKATMILGALCIVALAWRIHLILQPGFIAERTYYASDTRFDSILFGCCLAFATGPDECSSASSRMTIAQWVICGVGLSGLLVSLIYRKEEFRESVRYTIQGLCLIPIFHYAVRYPHETLFRALNHRVIKCVGVYSYSVYLIHFVIVNVIKDNVASAIPPMALLLIVFSLSCTYAFLVDQFVEPYFRALRKKLH